MVEYIDSCILESHHNRYNPVYGPKYGFLKHEVMLYLSGKIYNFLRYFIPNS